MRAGFAATGFTGATGATGGTGVPFDGVTGFTGDACTPSVIPMIPITASAFDTLVGTQWRFKAGLLRVAHFPFLVRLSQRTRGFASDESDVTGDSRTIKKTSADRRHADGKVGWCAPPDLNRRPWDYESRALTN